MEGDHGKVLRDFECQKMELAETRRMVEELKRENQVKSRECQEALKSLQELQNELMRKSMHVGSLGMEISFFLGLNCLNYCKCIDVHPFAAFAVEGQVKEKSKWFSSLRDLTRKLKVLKLKCIELFSYVSIIPFF